MLLNRSSVFVESFPRFVGTGGGVLGRSVSICPSNTIRSFTNQTSKTFIDRLSPTLPEIESSLRFSGRWERFKGVGNPCFPYTRNDLLVECKGRWSEGKSDITTMLQTMKVFEVDLSIEKRGRLPFSQTKYLPKLERDLGNELEILKMTIDSENVLKILQFDGEKKEILQIEQEDENGIVSTGFIGMEKGYLFVRFQQHERIMTTHLEPQHSFLFRHLVLQVSITPLIEYGIACPGSNKIVQTSM